MAVNLAYSRAVAGGLRFGAKREVYKQQHLECDRAELRGGFRGDDGDGAVGLRLGAAVQNVGPGLKFLDETDALPLTVAGGAGYRVGRSGLLLALDVKTLPLEGRTTVSLGTEYAMFSALSIRAGYLSALAAGDAAAGGVATQRAWDLSGFGAGLGLRVGSYTLDYSFTPSGELGSVQRISLGAKF